MVSVLACLLLRVQIPLKSTCFFVKLFEKNEQKRKPSSAWTSDNRAMDKLTRSATSKNILVTIKRTNLLETTLLVVKSCKDTYNGNLRP